MSILPFFLFFYLFFWIGKVWSGCTYNQRMCTVHCTHSLASAFTLVSTSITQKLTPIEVKNQKNIDVDDQIYIR